MTQKNYSADLVNTIVGVVAREVRKRHSEFMSLIWQKA